MATNEKQTTAPQPPAGMRQIDTDLDAFPSWDWDKDGLLHGNVIKCKSAKVKRDNSVTPVDTRLCVVDVKGDKYLFWESAGLGELFDEVRPGNSVWVNPGDKVPLSRGRTMRTFEAYIGNDSL